MYRSRMLKAYSNSWPSKATSALADTVSSSCALIWFRHQVPSPGVHQPAPRPHRAGHAGRARGLRGGIGRVQGAASACTCCELPPTLAISRLANTSKRVSSRRLRQEFPDRTLTTGGLNAWCGSYFAGSVGWWRARHRTAPIHRPAQPPRPGRPPPRCLHYQPESQRTSGQLVHAVAPGRRGRCPGVRPPR